MDICGLHILRPHRIQRIVDAEGLTECVGYGERISPRTSRRSGGTAVDCKRKRWAGSQSLIKRVALKKAGSTVSAADHELVHRLVSEPYSRHKLIVISVVARACGAEFGSRNRLGRNSAGILYDSAR